MRAYLLSHLSDGDLLRRTAALIGRDRVNIAVLLAHLAEVERRKLHLRAAYPCMRAYCIGELGMSQDEAYKRIQAARAARRFPAIFEAVADGRLSLSAVVLLKPRLTRGNAGELLKAAEHKTREEVRALLAARFPQSEELGLVEALPAKAGSPSMAAEPIAASISVTDDPVISLVSKPVEARPASSNQQVQQSVATRVANQQVAPEPLPQSRTTVTPIAHQRYAIHVSVGQSTRDKLQRAQDLLSHAVPSGDIAQVLDRALDALITQLERRKYGATEKPRTAPSKPSANPRHIPAHVRRAVRERDGDRCTFESETGHRCEERKLLQFDHVVPVACGGQATVENIRLRCHGHNQYEAERSFGEEFMNEKREQARRAANTRRRSARVEGAVAKRSTGEPSRIGPPAGCSVQ